MTAGAFTLILTVVGVALIIRHWGEREEREEIKKRLGMPTRDASKDISIGWAVLAVLGFACLLIYFVFIRPGS